MIQTKIPVTVDMNEGLKRIRVEPLMMTGNNKAHTFEVTVLPEGALEGANITATFIRADGATVALTGSRNGDVATVTLDKYCYKVQGRAMLTITAANGDPENGGAATSLLFAEINVMASSTDTVADTGVIPSIAEIAQRMSDVEAATTAANGAATRATAAAEQAEPLIPDMQAANAILEQIQTGLEAGPVLTVNGQTGVVTIPESSETASGLMTAADKTRLGALNKIRFVRAWAQKSIATGGTDTTVSTTFTVEAGETAVLTGFGVFQNTSTTCYVRTMPSLTQDGVNCAISCGMRTTSSTAQTGYIHFYYAVYS